MSELPEATNRFLLACAALGVDVCPEEYPEGTRTSADAARAVGCPLSAIAKSLVFMADDEPVLVLMSGDKRVDTAKLAAVCEAEVAKRAGLEEAREHTGFAAGGTPAFGLARAMRVFADVSLRRNSEVWSAAGTPTTVYPIALETLVSVSGAAWVDVAE